MASPKLEDIVTYCGLLDISNLDVAITQKYYDDIAACFSEWKCVARKLEIDPGEIEGPNEKEKKIQFLSKLKSAKAMNATFRLLVTVLLESELAEDARRLCSVVQSKFIAIAIE